MSDQDKHGKGITLSDHPNLEEVSDDAALFEAHQAGTGEEKCPGYVPPNGYWPRVIMSGRWGFLGCQNQKTAKFRNILRRDALKAAEEIYGKCPKIINYYDEQGHLIETESP